MKSTEINGIQPTDAEKRRLTEALRAAKGVAIGASGGMSVQTATDTAGRLAKLSNHFDDLIRKSYPKFGV